MDWNSIYQSRITTAQDAVCVIQSGMRIFLTGNVSVPQKALAALVEYAPNLHNVEICQALTIGPADYVNPGMEEHLRVNTLFISHNVRKAVQERNFHCSSSARSCPWMSRSSMYRRRTSTGFAAWGWRSA
jgi:acetyl-CoA hydrolase